MPDYPNHPARVGRMQSLASICGRDTEGHGDGSSIHSSCLAGVIKPRMRARRQRWVNLPGQVIRCRRLCRSSPRAREAR